MQTTENKSIIAAGKSMASSFNSDVIPLKEMSVYFIQIFWSGSPVGSWSVQVSGDVGQQNPDGTWTGITNWSTYSSSSQSITAAGDIVYKITTASEKFARIAYTSVSGSGSVTTARYNAKGE